MLCLMLVEQAWLVHVCQTVTLAKQALPLQIDSDAFL